MADERTGLRTAVVGVRAVGREMVRVLRQRAFPVSGLRVFATRARDITLDGDTYRVEVINEEAFEDIDIAFFAGGDVREGHFGPVASRRGTVVIDNGDAFRLDPEVPLVVPEVNPEALRAHHGLIANPNCSTIQFVMALRPLHDAARLKRAVVATYQAVSGRGTSKDGSDPVEQLRAEMASISARLEPLAGQGTPEERLHDVVEAVSKGAAARVRDAGLFPHPIAGNLIPQISSFDDSGYSREEMKLVNETRKILGEPELRITATTVRVPVFNGHAEVANLEFERPISAAQAREVLSRAPGVAVVDDPEHSGYPMPLYASGKDEVFVGRIREDTTVPHGLSLWIVADNLRKGAALNAVQIAEKMIEMGLLRARGRRAVAR
jgi:aspartate-semialdehyde dehydrogenase